MGRYHKQERIKIVNMTFSHVFCDLQLLFIWDNKAIHNFNLLFSSVKFYSNRQRLRTLLFFSHGKQFSLSNRHEHLTHEKLAQPRHTKIRL